MQICGHGNNVGKQTITYPEKESNCLTFPNIPAKYARQKKASEKQTSFHSLSVATQ